ncbi:MAG: Gfo/Idh/MocA family oxidoreductase [Bryobacterales bacterium]
MRRRSFLAAGLAFAARASAAKTYRAAVIGHTGRGNYGHGLDTVWRAFPQVEVVAVADAGADTSALAAAKERTGAQRTYSDYREMLAKEKPDIVSIGPRHMDQRVAMVSAAAQAGAHIYCEKAFAENLEDADRMVEAVQKAGVKFQLAHQMRMSPFVREVARLVRDGQIGVIQEVRGRGKEDSRAGGEDMMVLGSHILDDFRIFLGDPQWVFAHVTHDGEELDRKRRTPTREPVGPTAGREIAAQFAFARGVHAYFASKQNDQTHPDRFGVHIYGSRGVIFLPNAIYPNGRPSILRSLSWHPEDQIGWEPIEVAFTPPPGVPDHDLANALMALDLIDAIEQNRKPACSEVDGRWTIEMISGIYGSQLAGKPLRFPLDERRHPLTYTDG